MPGLGSLNHAIIYFLSIALTALQYIDTALATAVSPDCTCEPLYVSSNLSSAKKIFEWTNAAVFRQHGGVL